MIIKKENGGGEIRINGLIISFITLLILIISTLVGAVSSGTQLKSDVEYLKEQYNEAGPRHLEVIKTIENRVSVVERTADKNSIILIEIKSDIKEMKEDIKEIKRAINNV